MYRVGPLARLNVCERMGTPAGRRRAGRVPPARRPDRLVVVLVPLRPADRDPRLRRADRADDRRPRPASRTASGPRPASTAWRASASARRPGAPSSTTTRSTRTACIRSVNLIIATGQNNLAMNAAMAQIARHYINGPADPRGRPQPPGGRHPRLRPLPELLDPRRRPDADGRPADRPRRGGPRRGPARRDLRPPAIAPRHRLRQHPPPRRRRRPARGRGRRRVGHSRRGRRRDAPAPPRAGRARWPIARLAVFVDAQPARRGTVRVRPLEPADDRSVDRPHLRPSAAARPRPRTSSAPARRPGWSPCRRPTSATARGSRRPPPRGSTRRSAGSPSCWR